MAASYHTRSNSFPFKQHPLIADFDEKLRRLRSSQEASSSSTSIAAKLNGLQELHDCADRLLLLPLNQQALSKEQNEKSVDELLDGSLRILDMCNTTKDSLTQIKESTQEILSIMRRRRGGSDLSTEVKKFLATRKMTEKSLDKAMGNRREIKSRESTEIAGVLREVESITIDVFELLISFVSGTNSQKSSRWSLVSKMMNPKHVACEGIIGELNEFERVDAALNMFIAQKTKKSDLCKKNAQSELKKLEICIREIEEGLASLYRRLIKTRVSLLNILNH